LRLALAEPHEDLVSLFGLERIRLRSPEARPIESRERANEEHGSQWLEELGDAGGALRDWRAAIVADIGGESLGTSVRYTLCRPQTVRKKWRVLSRKEMPKIRHVIGWANPGAQASGSEQRLPPSSSSVPQSRILEASGTRMHRISRRRSL
jgi:hypothetical protein